MYSRFCTYLNCLQFSELGTFFITYIGYSMSNMLGKQIGFVDIEFFHLTKGKAIDETKQTFINNFLALKIYN